MTIPSSNRSRPSPSRRIAARRNSPCKPAPSVWPPLRHKCWTGWKRAGPKVWNAWRTTFHASVDFFDGKTYGGRIHAIGESTRSGFEEDALGRTDHECAAGASAGLQRRREIDEARFGGGGIRAAWLSREPHTP